MVKEAGGKHRGPRKEGDSEVQGEEARAAKPPSLPRGSGGADAERRGPAGCTHSHRELYGCPHLPLRVHGPQISAGERLSFDLGAYRNCDVRMGKRSVPCETTTRRVCPHEGLGLPAEESGFDPTGHESWVTKRINGLEPTALSSLASVAARPWGPGIHCPTGSSPPDGLTWSIFGAVLRCGWGQAAQK